MEPLDRGIGVGYHSYRAGDYEVTGTWHNFTTHGEEVVGDMLDHNGHETCSQ